MTRRYEESELILHPDGSVFHLHMKPGELGDHVLLVGDPGRVNMIAEFFDQRLSQASNREFFSITGMVKHTKITAISTGIGADNMDIVLNELDALVNIDFDTRLEKKDRQSLNLIRIGTSGAVHESIEPGSTVVSQYGIGFDGLLNFYRDRDQYCDLALENQFMQHTHWPKKLAHPYAVKGSETLMNLIGAPHFKGITLTANGFYAPQGRELRGMLAHPDLFASLPTFSYEGIPASNFEMECSALYGLSRILGHQSITVCLIIANRAAKTFLGDYQSRMKLLIEQTINALVNE